MAFKVRLEKRIREFAESGKAVLGICGGFQILGKKIYDPYGVESARKEISGMNLLPVITTLEADKVVRKVTGRSIKNNKPVSGYEIHMGQTRIINQTGIPFLKLIGEDGDEIWQDGCYLRDAEIAGTYLHGILDSPGFRGIFKQAKAQKGIKERRPGKGRAARFREYERLADHFERYCDIEKILKEI